MRAGLSFLTAACFWACLLVLTLASCASLTGTRLTPLAIAPALLGERTVEQRLVIRFPGGERSMEAVLEIDEQQLRLVLLAFGIRLSSLEYGGNGKTLVETRHVPHAPEGARILNDLLMIAAPLEALRQALPPDVVVTETHVGQQRRREISRTGAPGGAANIVIDYETDSPWQGTVRFSHPDQNYELTLTSHEL